MAHISQKLALDLGGLLQLHVGRFQLGVGKRQGFLGLFALGNVLEHAHHMR